jgi:hypothetical protein
MILETYEVSGESIEESLLRELILKFIENTHCNIVVSIDSINLAP